MMETAVLKVEGMSCNHCVQSIEQTLEKIGASGKVDLNKATVEVNYDREQVSLEQVKEAIEDQGYDVVNS